jgi:hypothetical protein
MLAHPDTDSQQLRSLVRAARRDAAALAPERGQPQSFRELFQFIKPLLPNLRPMNDFDRVRIGLVSISDRASSGVYPDQGIPALRTGCSAR